MTTQTQPKCKHEWVEDEMFACGAVFIIAGRPSDLNKETRFVCNKCGKSDYRITEKLGSLLDTLEESHEWV